MLDLPVQLVACAWLDCLYNWLLRLYRQRKHRQPVIQAAQAQATSYTDSYIRQIAARRDPIGALGGPVGMLVKIYESMLVKI